MLFLPIYLEQSQAFDFPKVFKDGSGEPKGGPSAIRSQEFANLLPASRRNEETDNLFIPRPESILDWINAETNLERLDNVYDHLWLVGRPMPPRPLHYQRILSREIYITEKMDMHLVWCNGRIYIKPLPRFILEPCFWKDSKCHHDCSHTEKLHKSRRCAWGFLFSYVALMPNKSDYEMAKANGLLPEGLEWSEWRNIVALVMNDPHLYTSIHRRFRYGELRLNRLNKIYFYWHKLGKGYLSRWNQYASYFQDNLGILASTLAYIVIVLTAMQVGLATDQAVENAAFHMASFGFTIFALIGPLAALVTIVLLFLIIFIKNWMATLKYWRKRQEQFDSKSGNETLLPAGSSSRAAAQV